jgi:hypothetical protein
MWGERRERRRKCRMDSRAVEGKMGRMVKVKICYRARQDMLNMGF